MSSVMATACTPTNKRKEKEGEFDYTGCFDVSQRVLALSVNKFISYRLKFSIIPLEFKLSMS